jgi:hypothetical protein
MPFAFMQKIVIQRQKIAIQMPHDKVLNRAAIFG